MVVLREFTAFRRSDDSRSSKPCMVIDRCVSDACQDKSGTGVNRCRRLCVDRREIVRSTAAATDLLVLVTSFGCCATSLIVARPITPTSSAPPHCDHRHLSCCLSYNARHLMHRMASVPGVPEAFTIRGRQIIRNLSPQPYAMRL